ncbi:hypothetical protein EM87_024330, partial [Vibrio parahaemolyticus]
LYPGALDVSIATQLAIRSQSMKPLELIEGEAGLRRASWWLNLMVKANPDLALLRNSSELKQKVTI